LGVMVFLSFIGFFVCLAAGSEKKLNKDGEFLLVTSFYPMYVLAENLTAGTADVTVSNLTENQTGCLHDYQLTSRDMKLLDRADAFLINGAGMELFLEKVMESDGELPIIEASRGIALLEGVVHDHAEEDGHQAEHEAEHDEASHEEHDHAHAENGHVWMDVEQYRKQLAKVTKELQELMPKQADALLAAATVYDNKLQVLAEGVKDLKEHTEGVHVVIFHEAFAYLAESLGMEVLMALSLDEETLPGPGEIAEVIEEINYHGTALIFIEEEYASYADKIMAETDAEVVYIDPLTAGDGSADSYLSGMWENLSAIRQAVE
ncbi:MAG: zinc ABC transporter substrate-binding protein, partial [Lachnospiraceae bacterium]|nr:zinc ABC transporter substrate-binding protein [Lachnospiraceae bacterium]